MSSRAEIGTIVRIAHASAFQMLNVWLSLKASLLKLSRVMTTAKTALRAASTHVQRGI